MNEFSIKPIEFIIEKINNEEYYISNFNIYNNKHKMLGYINKGGYKVISCVIDGKNKKAYVHRVIFAYYNGLNELLKYESLNHIDGNKLNNDISNLEGLSLADNTKHQWENGMAKSGSDCSYAILDEHKVSQIKKLLHLNHSQYVIAKYYMVHRSTILNIKLGYTWSDVKLDLDIEIPTIPKAVERKPPPNKMLSNEDISYIRDSIVDGIHTRKELAKKFNVSYSAIRKYSTGLRTNKKQISGCDNQ